MSFRNRVRSVITGSAVAGAMWLCAANAMAQATPAALPTAPGADRTVGTAVSTAAKASLPGDNGSPLEPYLFTFILAGGGLICLVGVRLADKRIQSDYARFTPEMRKRYIGIV
jgi:hypothetical protein